MIQLQRIKDGVVAVDHSLRDAPRTRLHQASQKWLTAYVAFTMNQGGLTMYQDDVTMNSSLQQPPVGLCYRTPWAGYAGRHVAKIEISCYCILSCHEDWILTQIRTEDIFVHCTPLLVGKPSKEQNLHSSKDKRTPKTTLHLNITTWKSTKENKHFKYVNT